MRTNTESTSRMPFGGGFRGGLTTAVGPRGGVLLAGQAFLRRGETSESPVTGSDLDSILSGARVVATREVDETVRPVSLPVSALRTGLTGESAFGYAPDLVPPMPMEVEPQGDVLSQLPLPQPVDSFALEGMKKGSGYFLVPHL